MKKKRNEKNKNKNMIKYKNEKIDKEHKLVKI